MVKIPISNFSVRAAVRVVPSVLVRVTMSKAAILPPVNTVGGVTVSVAVAGEAVKSGFVMVTPHTTVPMTRVCKSRPVPLTLFASARMLV